MRNIKLIIEYDGTNYCGWQKQKDVATIQESIERAIQNTTGEFVDLVGSSRTDAGVHAKGFVANFKTSSRIPAERFREALNVKLPSDIRILESYEVDSEFHARYSAKGKTYSYSILSSKVARAIGRNYIYFEKDNLNIAAMREACNYFIGKHDFIAFKSSGSSVKTTVRTISDMYIEQNGDIIEIFITADGFLYNMVRIIVGTLILVGKEKIEPSYVKNIIYEKKRNNAGPCVPPTGLILQKVFYEK